MNNLQKQTYGENKFFFSGGKLLLEENWS